MSTRFHLSDRESCPFLPPATTVLSPSYSRSQRGTQDYYFSTLSCAQSLWLQGKPAQALLQLNHTLSIINPPPSKWPLPYEAIFWILTHRHQGGFMGNPVRHFQHLASRMSEPNKEIRSWRAWACFHLAQSILPDEEFPPDHQQIKKENLDIPNWDETLEKISLLTSAKETELLRKLLNF